MELEISLDKTIEQNAAEYYERAKKAKQKREGLLEAIKNTENQIELLQKEKELAIKTIEQRESNIVKARKKEWYEKFHWFFSSEGFLCIGGRDATSNELVIKKHAEKDDLVLHTNMSGSPFFVIKNGQNAGEATLHEAAQATASYSKAWKLGMSTIDVFCVKPEQVTKKAKPGEFIAKGAFMVYGESKSFRPWLELAVGITEANVVIGGSVNAVKASSKKYVVLVPGKNKTSDVAKKIKKSIGADLDEIAVFIPAGGSEIKNN